MSATPPADPLAAPQPVAARCAGFEALAGLACYGVMLLSDGGEIVFCSDVAAEVLGEHGRDALRRAWPGLLARRRAAANGAEVHATLEVGSPGRVRWVRLEMHGIGGGAAPHMLLIESLAESAVSQLRLASQALTNAYLASALLHEINAPLNNVKLTLALCDASLARAGESALPGDLRTRLDRYFKVVSDETSRLGTLLEELRQMSSASPVPAETFALQDVNAEIARLMRHEATIRQIRLRTQAIDEPLHAYADRRVAMLSLLGLVIHLVEQTEPEGVVCVDLSRGGDREACITLDSTAATAVEATRLALESVAGGLRREDIPLVAARTCIETLHGRLTVTEAGNRFGFRVALPLAAA
jgi:signal transduction histidine kinase